MPPTATAEELAVIATISVERTPGDGMDNKNNKALFHTSITTINSTAQEQKQQQQPITATVVTANSQQQSPTVVTATETNEAQSIVAQQQPIASTTEQQRPHFEASDLSPPSLSSSLTSSTSVTPQNHQGILNKQLDTDITKSLPSDLNSTFGYHNQQQQQQPQHLQGGEHSHQQQSHYPQLFQKSSTTSDLVIDSSKETPEFMMQQNNNSVINANAPMWQQHQKAPVGDRKPPSQQTTPAELKNFEPNLPQHQQPPVSAFDHQQQKSVGGGGGSDLYEPFNSRTSWPIGGGFGGSGVGVGGMGGQSQQPPLSGSRFKSMWSEATYTENDRVC